MSRTRASFSHLQFFCFWGTPRKKASFSYLQLSGFEGCLVRKLCFHIFRFHFLRAFEGRLARQLRFRIFHLHFLRGLARNAVLKDSGCTECYVLQDKTCLGRWMGKVCGAPIARRSRLYRDHGRELPLQASFCTTWAQKNDGCLARFLSQKKWWMSCTFSHLQLSGLEGRKSFVFTSSTFSFWGKSRTKALFSHLQLAVFEGSLARKNEMRDQMYWHEMKKHGVSMQSTKVDEKRASGFWRRWSDRNELRWGWLR